MKANKIIQTSGRGNRVLYHALCFAGKWLTRSPTVNYNEEGVIKIAEPIEKDYMEKYMEAN